MQLLRLRGRKIVERVKSRGRGWRGRHMQARILPGVPPHPAANPVERAVYVGVLSSAKLDKSAVKRNRMRRRCREALRLSMKGHSNLPTVRLLLLPRSSSLQCDFAELLSDAAALLSSLRTL